MKNAYIRAWFEKCIKNLTSVVFNSCQLKELTFGTSASKKKRCQHACFDEQQAARDYYVIYTTHNIKQIKTWKTIQHSSQVLVLISTE